MNKIPLEIWPYVKAFEEGEEVLYRRLDEGNQWSLVRRIEHFHYRKTQFKLKGPMIDMRCQTGFYPPDKFDFDSCEKCVVIREDDTFFVKDSKSVSENYKQHNYKLIGEFQEFTEEF